MTPRLGSRTALAWLCAVAVPSSRATAAADGALVSRATGVMKRHCFKCHIGPDAEGGIDLAHVLRAPLFADQIKTWRRVADALDKKVMPPEEEAQPPTATRQRLVSIIRKQLALESPAGWPQFAEPRSFELRRLTSEQYLASVQTLLGVSVKHTPLLEPISPVQGFPEIAASIVGVSDAGIGQFENAARFLARAAFAPKGSRTKLVPCTPSDRSDDPCTRAFVTAFGSRVFRRPLAPGEVSRYTALATEAAAATGDVWKGLEAATSVFLQSPHFLYLTEVGEPDPINPIRYRYTGHEMAARLSYFLTGDTPDDPLLEAAATGTLVTAEGVREQAERLVALPAAHDAVRSFFTGLLALEPLDNLELGRGPGFPDFSTTLGPAMKQETLLVIDDLVFGRDGDYRRLFDQKVTFVNQELAAHYGLPAPAGHAWARVVLPPESGRVGLLGQAGVLAARDNRTRTSPTKRGLFILTHLLCQDLPLTPPANLKVPDAPKGRLTQKQRLETHVSNPVCAGCHRPTDGVGLSLERLDALGVYRDTDQGMAIDDTGEMDGKKYRGLAGLAAILAEHPALAPCLVQSLYSVAVGHPPTTFDRASFAAMVKEFETNGGRIRPLLVAIARSDGFRYRPPPLVASKM